MSREIFVGTHGEGEATELKTSRPQGRFSKLLSTGSSGPAEPVRRVWCAPMSDAGEWVVTWTPVPGAVNYEVQTSPDGGHWSSGSKFAGTRAVLLLGPSPKCWVRVRAMTADTSSAWSEPKLARAGERFPEAA